MLAKLYDLRGTLVKVADVPAPPRGIVRYRDRYFLVNPAANPLTYWECDVHEIEDQVLQ